MDAMQTSVNTRVAKSYRRGVVLSDSIIQGILSRTDIVQVIRDILSVGKEKKSKKTTLKKIKGAEQSIFLTCCLFHAEANPSFHVYNRSQRYYCYGCGAKGDVIKFLMDYCGWNFSRTITFLAKRAGVKLKYKNFPIEAQEYERNNDKGFFGDDESSFENVEGIFDEGYEYEYEFEGIYEEMTELYGKNIAEILGYEPDGFPGANEELSSMSGLERDFEGLILDFDAFLEEERQEAQIREKEIRINRLKSEIRIRIEALSGERRKKEQVIQAARMMQEFIVSQQHNVSALTGVILADQKAQESFFQSQKYEFRVNGPSLSPGSIGKVILVYVPDIGFYFVFSKERLMKEIPANFNGLDQLLDSANMANHHGISHNKIEIPGNAVKIGGVQFIVLDDSNILLSGKSLDFGGVSHDLVRACLSESGYNPIFLRYTDNKERAIIYRGIQNELERIRGE